MDHFAVDYVKNFFAELNKRLGLVVKCEIVEKEKDKFPICRRDGRLAVIPNFFNHAELSDEIKTTILAELYSCFYLDNSYHYLIAPFQKYNFAFEQSPLLKQMMNKNFYVPNQIQKVVLLVTLLQ